jgi:acyl-CoA synthetase (AMP-forming)/AMP-acid ligase II
MRFRVDAPLGDSDDGHRRAATSRGEGGTVGELQFAGPSLMLEYLDDPENTAAVFDGEWLRTGDLVRMDDDGYVYFLERLKDLIIRGGFNISSVEIEEAILQYPGIAQAAAFGVAHPTLGEVVGLAVVPTAPGLDVSALRTHARRVLARVKVPAWILVTDELPLSPAGKILKSRLRDHSDLVNWED